MRFLAFLCLFFAASIYAQVPVVLGAVLETGSGLLGSADYGAGIVRITPFAGVWINGIGFARIGISTDSQKTTDEDGSLNELKRMDISVQAGVTALGPEYPYIAASYVKAGSYSNAGDSKWNEWGLGIGHRFSLSPFAAIVIEAEHRWIAEHYYEMQQVSGRRLQINFGLVANPF
jgi:hypothetical protein